MNKTSIAIIISALLIVGAIFFTSNKNSEPKEKPAKISQQSETVINNVSVVPASTQGGDNKQIIEIRAKGGYTPRKSIAKSGMPTILRINTNGTFDCSSSIRIPSMNIYKNLPQSGITDIDLGVSNPGVLNGSCGMGMYPFQIEFQ